MLLVLRLLEQNVPADFIVSILVISNKSIQQELGLKLLPAGELSQEKIQSLTLPDYYLRGEVIPLKIKVTIDAWAHEIINRCQENATRILATVLDPNGIIKLPAIQLAVFCLRDYLKGEGIAIDYELMKNFVQLMMEGILKKVKEEFENRKMLNS